MRILVLVISLEQIFATVTLNYENLDYSLFPSIDAIQRRIEFMGDCINEIYKTIHNLTKLESQIEPRKISELSPHTNAHVEMFNAFGSYTSKPGKVSSDNSSEKVLIHLNSLVDNRALSIDFFEEVFKMAFEKINAAVVNFDLTFKDLFAKIQSQTETEIKNKVGRNINFFLTQLRNALNSELKCYNQNTLVKTLINDEEIYSGFQNLFRETRNEINLYFTEENALIRAHIETYLRNTVRNLASQIKGLLYSPSKIQKFELLSYELILNECAERFDKSHIFLKEIFESLKMKVFSLISSKLIKINYFENIFLIEMEIRLRKMINQYLKYLMEHSISMLDELFQKEALNLGKKLSTQILLLYNDIERIFENILKIVKSEFESQTTDIILRINAASFLRSRMMSEDFTKRMVNVQTLIQN